ncbi:hypothetical protein KC721_03945 [Candidatus Woesebacteria bacterium]|nr:hypothetical protein [Candidatus Woesebacteria bacterium]
MMTIEYLRSFRIGPYAIFDFAVSYLGIALVSPLLSKLTKKIGFTVPFSSWMWLTLPIGVLAHIAAGNITPLTEQTLSPNSGWVSKAILALMVVLAVKKIKRAKKKK